jgi:carbamate kinase
LRSERAADQVYTHPLDVCDATTQGEIGYLLQQSLQAALAEAGLTTPVATVVTQVVVSSTDPAMDHPTKPIGPFYSEREAQAKRQQFGWAIVEDAARGYRRVVPSPEPLEIVEEGVIRRLIDTGVLVIAVGGGGIPVVRRGRALHGVEAVIDKDRASALLAARLKTDCFIMSTDADRVYVNYKKPDQRPLGRVTVAEVEGYYRDGQFPPGNMGPKVQSALRFLRDGGREVIITSCERLLDAVRGDAGTHIVTGE